MAPRWHTLLRDAVSGSESDRARHLLGYVGLASFVDRTVGPFVV